jgi:predicted esterase
MRKLEINKKLFFILIALLIVPCYSYADPPKIIDNSSYILYLPSGIDAGRRYPLVVALSPSADAQTMLNTWKYTSERYKWIIFASKEFRNGIDMNKLLARLKADLESVISNYPIDRSKIIATGLSGGGMGSHALAFFYPSLIYAVVINTGMIHEYYSGQSSTYPRGKVAVFLASPTDFRYQEMRRDRDFLVSLGWRVKWIEFEGGHIIAPADAYEQAAAWLNEEFSAQY